MRADYSAYCVQQNAFRVSMADETVFTVSNGNFGLRGSHDFCYPNAQPGTFLAGIFNKSEAQVRELVRLPYALALRLYANDMPINLAEISPKSYRRWLDMSTATLREDYTIQMPGVLLSITTRRAASLADRNLALQAVTVYVMEGSARIFAEAWLDGNVYNGAASPANRVRHITSQAEVSPDGVSLCCATREGAYTVALHSKLRHVQGPSPLRAEGRSLVTAATEQVECELLQGEQVTFHRLTAICSSRQHESPAAAASDTLKRAWAEGFDVCWQAHEKAMAALWAGCDIAIQGDVQADRALRFNVFSLLCMANPEDEGVSIGAKALHGEGYKGHVFWDTEIFMLPFYTLTQPQTARTLLLYRYHALDSARENARLNGFRGAQFPWESADTGLEETPKWGRDYMGNPVRIWTGDIECHITADVAYAVAQYIEYAADEAFFADYGAEILLETARFWASRLEYNSGLDRYELRDVIGPDEFHEHVDNNYYTNALAQWNLRASMQYAARMAGDHPQQFAALLDKIHMTQAEIDGWDAIAGRIYLPLSTKGLLLEQFEGYFQLEDPPITAFDENHMPLWPEGVDITDLNRYQLVKQADVIMVMFLLGDAIDLATKEANYVYYEKRTMHKSSLSPSMYALMGMMTGHPENAYTHFLRTALVDLSDNQGNSAEGLHAASAGGTWMAMVHGFLGVYVDGEGMLHVAPKLPEGWQSVRFPIVYRGHSLRLEAARDEVRLLAHEGPGPFSFIANGAVVNCE